MKILENNYTKIVDENIVSLNKLQASNAQKVLDIVEYFRGKGISLFELEVIKKDMIGFAKEADIEQISLEEKLGIPIQKFCENMGKEESSTRCKEHILKILKNIVYISTICYAVEFFLYKMPIKWGISLWDISFYCAVVLLNYGIDYLIDKFVFDPSKIKWLSRLRILLWILYITIVYILMIYTENLMFIIVGNGWVILCTLILLSLIVCFVNNYYWNKQSEKYNWK
ncbi:MAG: hypothetical protein Q4B89_07315 [Lachnospiraceae bacterium]|nr:hypothetical protein [Lachnospiraceae bacterium]